MLIETCNKSMIVSLLISYILTVLLQLSVFFVVTKNFIETFRRNVFPVLKSVKHFFSNYDDIIHSAIARNITKLMKFMLLWYVL